VGRDQGTVNARQVRQSYSRQGETEI